MRGRSITWGSTLYIHPSTISRSRLVVDDPGCSRRQKFALSCSNSLIPEHLEDAKGEGGEGGGKRWRDGQHGGKRKRRRRTTWRYRGVCMKVSTRCDIGLPFRPPEVIAPSPPPLHFWPCDSKETKTDEEEFFGKWSPEDFWQLSRVFFFAIPLRWISVSILGVYFCVRGYQTRSRRQWENVSRIHTRDGFVEIYRRFMQIMRSLARERSGSTAKLGRVSRRCDASSLPFRLKSRDTDVCSLARYTLTHLLK